MRLLPITFIAALAACEPVVTEAPAGTPAIAQDADSPRLSTRAALQNFSAVVAQVEPVAEQYCRESAPELNCDFRIVIDRRPGQPANAYQTLQGNGRPLIGFTVPLIENARNVDEIAFVLSHEAAHHIRGHIARQQQSAAIGAAVLGELVGSLGAPYSVETAQQIGASVGARSFSKTFELEADALGTRIAAAAGYDPLKGAQFFFRIPDPGDKFLGTHPANADRLRTVQREAAAL